MLLICRSAFAEEAAASAGFFDSLVNTFKMSLKSGQGPFVLFLAFVAGFVSSLTPCVYPMIPITLSLFGANGDVPRSRAFLLSLTYVLGIAVTYTTLGLICATTGMVFGSFLGNPIVVGVLCFCLVLLTLYTLEIVEFGFISKVQNSASQVGGKGFGGAFLMGAASGLVAAPCVGPILTGILSFVAVSGKVFWGGLILFSYSMGLGMIFLVLGTFSGLLGKLPRSGNWLHGVKFVMAVALLVVALFLSSSFAPLPLSSKDHYPILIGIAVLSIGLAVYTFKANLKTLKIVPALLLAVALFKIVMPDTVAIASKQESSGIEWLTSIPAALEKAKKDQKIVMVDLYADWCAACKELDSITFTDDSVLGTLGRFSTARVNFTNESEETSKISEEFGIIGLPSILFLDGSGKEIPDSRIVQFMEPAPFKAHLEKILQTPAN
jgi:thiol:disulfide interchange protein DsbD